MAWDQFQGPTTLINSPSMTARYNNSVSINPQSLFNATHRNVFMTNNHPPSHHHNNLVMIPPNHSSFIQPLPMPRPDYPPFWWDRPGPSYLQPHLHPRVNGLANQDTTEREVRKRK